MTYLLYLEIGSVAMGSHVNFTNAHSEEHFMQDATLFKDASHLNDKGAIKFTKNLIGQIESENNQQ